MICLTYCWLCYYCKTLFASGCLERKWQVCDSKTFTYQSKELHLRMARVGKHVCQAPLEAQCAVRLYLYKLLSSRRVWSSTWCMFRFSSLAWASFSGDVKTKRDLVRQPSFTAPESSRNDKIIVDHFLRNQIVSCSVYTN